mmetsp:Transcript_10888/g.22485  ORF Transcript_10888/g.22485 Transcript_10888/m.22485 type:complete len:211 (+) Transcript_10888:716-1348(+)
MVDPSSTSRSLALARNSSSVSTHASVTACLRCSSVSAGFAERHFWRFLGSHSTRASTQRLPEWPSRTTKPTTRLLSGASSSTFIMYRSSCTSLFPCQDAAPTETTSRPMLVSWTSDRCLFAEGFPAPAERSATCWWRLASSFSCAWAYSPIAWRSRISSVARWPCRSLTPSVSWSCFRVVEMACRSSSFLCCISSSCFCRFRLCSSDSCL